MGYHKIGARAFRFPKGVLRGIQDDKDLVDRCGWISHLEADRIPGFGKLPRRPLRDGAPYVKNGRNRGH